MASGIAHDFNNLLLSILGNTALPSDDLPEDHPGRHFVEQAGVAAERAAELTAQILAYSGEAQRTLQPVEVVQAVSELGSLLEPATSKKAELQVTHERREAWVEADPAQLRQVLMNLIVNASDALNGEAGIVSLRIAGVRLEDEEPSSWIGEPPAPGDYVRVDRPGRGMRDRSREPEPDLRSVLHHQGGWSRPGTGRDGRHPSGPRGRDPGFVHAGGGDHVQHGMALFVPRLLPRSGTNRRRSRPSPSWSVD